MFAEPSMKAFVPLALLLLTGTASPIVSSAQTGAAAASPSIAARDTYYLGETPRPAVEGLRPGEIVELDMLRMINRWLPDGRGGYRREPTLMHGWASYTAGPDGRVDLATAVPRDGVTRAVGPASLIWSARRSTDPLIAGRAFAAQGVTLEDDGTHLLRVFRGRDLVAEGRFRTGQERADMTRVEIIGPGLVGVFAAPAGARRLPTLIHMHGSEGGSIAKARADAQRYAEQGFATLALVYFAWPYEVGTLPVARAHHNIPVEMLDRARLWLARRAEADVTRIGLIGNSKGGEFAMVGAATYPWVRAAVGCVPSDIVWEGYGEVSFSGGVARNTPAAGTYSSWSWRGRPLAYLPTFATQESGFPDNTDRYDRARAAFPAQARAARIPIERTRARLFLIGGGRDRTWSSGAMVASLANAMDAAGRGAQVMTLVAPTGGHFLCGDGLYPHRAWQEDNASAFAPDIDAQGQAEVAANAGKVAFLREALGR